MRTSNRQPTRFVAWISRASALIILAVALTVGTPHRAEACCSPIVSDPLTEGATIATKVLDGLGWAAQAAHYALEVIQWATTNMDNILNMLINNLSQEVHALTTMTAAQAGIDAQSRETQKRFTTEISLQHSIILPTNTATAGGTLGKDTGNNMCNTAMRSMGARLTGDAITDFTRSLEDLTAHSREGDRVSVAQNDLVEECLRGYRDPKSAYWPILQKYGCKDPSTIGGGNYINADTKPSTVVDAPYYTLPVATTVTNNRLVLPYGQAPTGVSGSTTTTDTHELDFIAAVFACRRFRSATTEEQQASSSSTAAASTTDPLRIEQQIDQMTGNQSVNNICVREIARRTRIPQTVANNAAAGSVVQELYTAQVQRCRALGNEGIINPTSATPQADEQDCETNGRSMLEMDINEACHFAYPGFNNYMSGTGLTADDLTKMAHEHSGDCGKFIDELMKERAQFAKDMANHTGDHGHYVASQ